MYRIMKKAVLYIFMYRKEEFARWTSSWCQSDSDLITSWSYHSHKDLDILPRCLSTSTLDGINIWRWMVDRCSKLIQSDVKLINQFIQIFYAYSLLQHLQSYYSGFRWIICLLEHAEKNNSKSWTTFKTFSFWWNTQCQMIFDA